MIKTSANTASGIVSHFYHMYGLWPDITVCSLAETKHFPKRTLKVYSNLNNWPPGKQWILFPLELNVPLGFASGNIKGLKQNSLSPLWPVIKYFKYSTDMQVRNMDSHHWIGYGSSFTNLHKSDFNSGRHNIISAFMKLAMICTWRTHRRFNLFLNTWYIYFCITWFLENAFQRALYLRL